VELIGPIRIRLGREHRNLLAEPLEQSRRDLAALAWDQAQFRAERPHCSQFFFGKRIRGQQDGAIALGRTDHGQ
jgi:hypothetical protein